MFHAYSGKLTKLHSLLQLQRNISPHLDILQQIQAYSRSLHQFKPTLFRKSGSSFKSLEHFFIFVSKVNIQQFALHDSIIVITITIITTSTHVSTLLTPTTQTKHTSHPTQATYPSLPSRLVGHPRHPRQPCQHASRASKPPTLAHQPSKYAAHVSTLPTPSMLAQAAHHF